MLVGNFVEVRGRAVRPRGRWSHNGLLRLCGCGLWISLKENSIQTHITYLILSLTFPGGPLSPCSPFNPADPIGPAIPCNKDPTQHSKKLFQRKIHTKPDAILTHTRNTVGCRETDTIHNTHLFPWQPWCSLFSRYSVSSWDPWLAPLALWRDHNCHHHNWCVWIAWCVLTMVVMEVCVCWLYSMWAVSPMELLYSPSALADLEVLTDPGKKEYHYNTSYNIKHTLLCQWPVELQ